ncbi:hypothetical protein [Viridibacillus arvi]|uniref:hypothetical protein n=1 Tax=Viridibacillus arvi TaxID=263475 RepID=UPI0034D0085F
MIYKGLYPSIYQPIEVKIEAKNEEFTSYFCLTNERGTIYSKDEVLALFEQVKDFYEREDSNELVAEFNKRTDLNVYIHEFASKSEKFVKNENGKYQLPPAIYTFKKFDLDKRDWSCKCNWCGEKISSKVDTGYFKLHSPLFNIIAERACSEDCAKLIWKEAVKNWIHEKGFENYFE